MWCYKASFDRCHRLDEERSPHEQQSRAAGGKNSTGYFNVPFCGRDHFAGHRAEAGRTLESFTGRKLVDLLWHLPSGLIDRRYRPSLAEVESGRIATFEVEIVKHMPPPRRSLPYRVACQNDTGFLTLVFFHAKGTG
ncbi:MAG: hypothetical protein CM15mP21_8370 [Hyphomicrobiales bacterium]|nr:MAG: hypothetical protein CM15mP21_8370 [Hyphomicrobiales bacterium]